MSTSCCHTASACCCPNNSSSCCSYCCHKLCSVVAFCDVLCWVYANRVLQAANPPAVLTICCHTASACCWPNSSNSCCRGQTGCSEGSGRLLLLLPLPVLLCCCCCCGPHSAALVRWPCNMTHTRSEAASKSAATLHSVWFLDMSF
mgnify:CR=1 FL=1